MQLAEIGIGMLMLAAGLAAGWAIYLDLKFSLRRWRKRRNSKSNN